jgi:alpha/beta superfamily hydrolase
MSTTTVQIPNGDLRLEGALYAPESNPTGSIVVVCHPHPQRGGDMHNNGVMTIVRALYDSGIAALTFNFRGVGASQGAHDNGVGEQDDVRAALAFAAAMDGIERVGLAGYSFGAGMAAATVDDTVAALALVSAPSTRLATESKLVSYAGPVLMTSGDADHVSSIEALRQAASVIGARAEVVALSGVDHFWWGHEAELQKIVSRFFSGALS